MTDRFNPNAASLIFLFNDKNEILLMRRYNTGWSDGMFTVPSGHIEADEPATAAAIRETLEEVGVSIDKEDLKFAHMMHRKNELGVVYADFFFATKKWSGEPRNCEPNKCDLVEWYDIDKLPENTIPFIRTALQNYRDNIPFSEFDW